MICLHLYYKEKDNLKKKNNKKNFQEKEKKLKITGDQNFLT
jgi:hypothetical protein